MGALSHIKVLDLSRVLAGPWASQLLADLGADVVKVEKPDSGDDTRAWGPPWLADGAGEPTTDAAYYLCTNRNKRSLTVDMTQPEGQDILRRLAREADVVIENFKVGGLNQYGLDYPSLAAENPQLIYCSITGFGQDGPYAPRAGYDFLIQGMGGLMSVAGHAEWARDERFASNAVRVRHRDILIPLLRQTTVMKTTAAWVALLEPAAVPCGPINDLAAVFADPQVRHRGLRVDLPHAAGGTAPTVANPIRFSGTPVDYRRAPPALGQDTDSVLAELGLSAADIAALRARKVI